MDRTNIFIYILVMALGMGIFPLMQEAIVDKDMSSWSFTGAEFLKTLFQVFPYIWLMAFLLIPAFLIMKEKKAE